MPIAVPDAVCDTLATWMAHRDAEAIRRDCAAWDEQHWQAARWATQVHGIGPWLHARLEQSGGLRVLHPLLRDYLTIQRQRSAQRAELMLADLAAVEQQFAAQGLLMIPLKGSQLLRSHYPDPGLRPMADLDLLVRDAPRAVALLSQLGYRLKARSWKHQTLARPERDRGVVAYDGEHPQNPFGIDLHTRLQARFWGIAYDITSEAWASVETGSNGQRQLSSALLFHHLLIHTAEDMISRRLRLLQLHDLAQLAPQLHAADWTTLLNAARGRREQRLIYAPLLFAKRYMQLDDHGLLAALQPGVPPALRAYLQRTTLAGISFCNQAPSTIAEKLCWFHPGAERLQALRHAIVPDPGELGNWFPRLSAPHLLPLAYLRYAAAALGYGLRRLRGGRRRGIAAAPEQRRQTIPELE